MADRKFGIETLGFTRGRFRPGDGSRACRSTNHFVRVRLGRSRGEPVKPADFGNVYTRISNPTTAVLEERVAALEEGAPRLQRHRAGSEIPRSHARRGGDHIVSASTLYGGTYTLLEVNLRKLASTPPSSARTIRRISARVKKEHEDPVRRDARQSLINISISKR